MAAKTVTRNENEVGVSRATCWRLLGKLRGCVVIAHSSEWLRVCDACGVYELRQPEREREAAPWRGPFVPTEDRKEGVRGRAVVMPNGARMRAKRGKRAWFVVAVP